MRYFRDLSGNIGRTRRKKEKKREKETYHSDHSPKKHLASGIFTSTTVFAVPQSSHTSTQHHKKNKAKQPLFEVAQTKKKLVTGSKNTLILSERFTRQ